MKLFTHIQSLHQIREASVRRISGKKMNELPSLDDAWLAVKDGKILAFGEMSDLDRSHFNGFEEIDATGRLMLPSWVDSHTHLVFADWRNQEFVDRIQGLSYQEIAARGGGILNSAHKLREASEDELYESAMSRLYALIKKGTGAIEIKSGYGLNTESELKMLRVIRRIKESSPIPVKATFLGAHAFPNEFKENPEGYIDLIINEMIPSIAKEGLADYVDAFCEDGYFNLSQTERVMVAGKNAGMKPKVHVNQFNVIGGIEACVRLGALTVDHLEVLSDEDLEALKQSETLPVALPSCSFFLSIHYTPVRNLMDADLPVVLATDFNPGSSPSGNMNFVFSLACIKMKMTPAEAVNAMTLNAAAALELEEDLGSITRGKRANLILTKPVKALSYLPYAFGDDHIEQVYVNGEAFEM